MALRVLRVIVGAVVLVSASGGSAETITYTYDALGRLVKVVVAEGEAVSAQRTYEYDAADNRTRVNATGPASNSGNGNQTQTGPSRLKVSYNGRFFVQKKRGVSP